MEILQRGPTFEVIYIVYSTLLVLHILFWFLDSLTQKRLLKRQGMNFLLFCPYNICPKIQVFQEVLEQ